MYIHVFTFLFDHRLNRLDGHIYSVVLVVSPLVYVHDQSS